MKTIPSPGDKVTLSNHESACVYTITETYSSKGAVFAQLMYVNMSGRVVNAGAVDVASLHSPTPTQLNQVAPA
jgi:hypothetical protein